MPSFCSCSWEDVFLCPCPCCWLGKGSCPGKAGFLCPWPGKKGRPWSCPGNCSCPGKEGISLSLSREERISLLLFRESLLSRERRISLSWESRIFLCLLSWEERTHFLLSWERRISLTLKGRVPWEKTTALSDGESWISFMISGEKFASLLLPGKFFLWERRSN